MKYLRRIICFIIGDHDYVLDEFKGTLGVDSTWVCTKCGQKTGTEIEIKK